MFELKTDETVIDSSSPQGADLLKTCSQCPQAAFYLLRVKSENGEQEVGLCGAHFIEACARYPEVRRAVAVRVAG
jgi:hypothetical protein